MASKSFKIGEYAIGGIIRVEITGKVIQIKALDWNTKDVIDSGSCISNEPGAYRKVDDYLNVLTTYYYAEKIREWIETKIELK